MGRLAGRGLPNRLGRQPSRLGVVVQTEVQRNRRRDAEQEQRRWYKTSRWQRLRLKILARDDGQCQQTGVLLVGKHPAANSAVVDHKIPPRGDVDLFWDEDNLQAVCKSWHDGEKQSREKRGLV
ncbi:MAG: HNH endonuclease [Rhodobacteraceae bacterium]|nr:HNH endonuclease [Paracoccaceae bacterium]